MHRKDIIGDKPLSEMTMDELTFRRNGYLHDLRERGNRSAEQIAKRSNAVAGAAEAEAEIMRRLKAKVA